MSGKNATMSAKDATRSAKAATKGAKDATMSGKNATMSAKDATRIAKAATSAADAGTSAAFLKHAIANPKCSYYRVVNSQEITFIRFRLSGVPISRLFAVSRLLGFGQEGCPSHASSISWLFEPRK